MAKLVALLCLFFVAYASCNPITPEEAGILDALVKKADQLKDTIGDVIKNAVESIQNQGQKAVEKATKFLSGLKKKAEDMSVEIFLDVNDALKQVDAKVEELTGRAPGVNVTECTQMAAELHGTALQVIEDTKRCIYEKVDEGTEYVEQIVNVAHDFIHEMNEIKNRALGCAKGVKLDGQGYVKIVACLAKAAKDATAAAYSRVPIFVQRVTELGFFLEKSGMAMAECTVSKTINTFLTSTDAVVQRVEACIEQKISENTYAAIAA